MDEQSCPTTLSSLTIAENIMKQQLAYLFVGLKYEILNIQAKYVVFYPNDSTRIFLNAEVVKLRGNPCFLLICQPTLQQIEIIYKQLQIIGC